MVFQKHRHLTKTTLKSLSPGQRCHLTASKLASFAHVGYDSAMMAAREVFPGLNPVPEKKPGFYLEQAMKHGLQTEPLARSVLKKHPWVRERYEFDDDINDGLWSVNSVFTHQPSQRSFHISATPDMVIYDRVREVWVPVEIKCPWRKGNSEEPLTRSDYKPRHWIQVQVQCEVMDAPYGLLMIYKEGGSGSSSFLLYQIDSNPKTSKFILSLAFDTYCRALRKESFRAKPGEKKSRCEQIEEMMRLYSHCIDIETE